jgi:Ca2+/Na+ antiporter
MPVHELSIGSETMKHKALIAAAAALAFGAAAPTYAQNTKQVLRGTAIGAGGGAVAGALIPGLGVGEGALIGGAGGAAITALTKNRKYYRDNRGRRYYVKNGRRFYR